MRRVTVTVLLDTDERDDSIVAGVVQQTLRHYLPGNYENIVTGNVEPAEMDPEE